MFVCRQATKLPSKGSRSPWMGAWRTASVRGRSRVRWSARQWGLSRSNWNKTVARPSTMTSGLRHSLTWTGQVGLGIFHYFSSQPPLFPSRVYPNQLRTQALEPDRRRSEYQRWYWHSRLESRPWTAITFGFSNSPPLKRDKRSRLDTDPTAWYPKQTLKEMNQSQKSKSEGKEKSKSEARTHFENFLVVQGFPKTSALLICCSDRLTLPLIW